MPLLPPRQRRHARTNSEQPRYEHHDCTGTPRQGKRKASTGAVVTVCDCGTLPRPSGGAGTCLPPAVWWQTDCSCGKKYMATLRRKKGLSRCCLPFIFLFHNTSCCFIKKFTLYCSLRKKTIHFIYRFVFVFFLRSQPALAENQKQSKNQKQ